MSRNILAGFGVDVDAVAGWYVIPFHLIKIGNKESCHHSGLGPMEVKIPHWIFLEYGHSYFIWSRA
jgi:hypothetical protein